ncbi:type I DNA topoisomerase [Micrococcus sp.]|uniref:type I DNA topoisomerase n=1 Tax=Micrococcus sp. TaxID=1271 RepID=UPI0026DAAF92|nr:type I DNA topoisomerase [Micrococcus sp.]MDO4238973.1 type I DNA topoisomerase [Micrococcus sp.]
MSPASASRTGSTPEGKKLVIVESPAKSKSIAKYLNAVGSGWVVDSSVGHIRDLPKPSDLPADMKKGPYGKFAVDTDHGFTPYYVVHPDKKKKVTELKRELKDADALYLATDADREGEAIAWHLLDTLKPKVPVYRMTFGEITKEGVRRGLEGIRELDTHLVDAQETRRILDRLFGYELSPVLWRKVSRGLSAGRVQSVATRLVVERERERMAFVAARYWGVEGTFTVAEGAQADGAAGSSFTARLSTVDGRRVATGRDFTDAGALKDASSGKVTHLDEAAASSLAQGLAGKDFTVDAVEDKPYTRRPAAPFTTSTLQQEASRKLRMSSRVSMQVAQRLYENGYITYMRTDSVNLSQEAVQAARAQATELYGKDAVPAQPRTYAKRSENAQEAHEAVRPAGDSFRTPAQVKAELRPDEFRLYELIWKRTVASQMADAKGYTATLRFSATAEDGRQAQFAASGTVITFKGFLDAYEEGRDTESEDEKDSVGRRLPQVAEGDVLTGDPVEPTGHETSPPARYTEASIVAELERREIGRPSTYAPTISTIMDRGYVSKRGNALVPSWTAFAVIGLLEDHFAKYVDYDFTARMEDDLDRIAAGELAREAWLQTFYFGAPAERTEQGVEGLKHVVENLGEIDARAVNSLPVTDEITLRVGQYGPYLERRLPEGAAEGTTPDRANVPEDLAPDELTPAKAEELMAAGGGTGERELGTDPETGRTVVAKDGRYGPYVTEVVEEMTEEQLQAWMDAQPTEYYKNGKPKPKKKPAKEKPRTGSLFKTMSLDTVTLEQALQLMSLPRIVGADAEGEVITAQNGRFGPYLKKGTDSRSLESEDQIFSITQEQALEIYAQPKQRGRGTAKPPLAEFGEDPVSGKKVTVKEGRFGPYVTDGQTNITVPRGRDPEQLTAEEAYQLLADKRAKGPATKSGAKKPAARRALAKKAAATKPAAKKPASRKKD